MSSYNPFSWAMSAVSPAAKKRKADGISESAAEVTLESIMEEINELKKSTERIESMLMTLTGESKAEEEEEKEESKEEEENENDEKEEEEEDLLTAAWLAKFEQLKNFKKKNGHCQVSRSEDTSLQKWIVRQRYDKRKGTMSTPEIKTKKLDSLGFDWSNESPSPGKKRRKS